MNKKKDEFIHTIITGTLVRWPFYQVVYFTMLIDTVWHLNYLEL